MAKRIYSSDTEITITAVDEHSTRVVICAALGEATQAVDLLYLDIPIDERAKESPEEMFAFVRIVAREIASARKNLTPIHVQSERSALDRELWLAQQIQARLAPTIPAHLSGAEVAVEYKPVIWVDGDYCDVWTIEDGRLAFAVGHIFDKGLTAAMALSTLRTLLRTTMAFSNELSDVVGHVNRHLMASRPQHLSATLLLGLFDPSTGAVTFVNAGHPEPLVVHGPQNVKVLGASSEAMLGRGELELPTNTETLPQGAALVAFSQGLVNAQSPHDEHFGVKRLTHLLKATTARSAEQLTGSIMQAVNDFQDSLAQQHDISVVALVRSR
jgi:sigma-B regulation protein RsbU (phosphoserine phosphatase)